MATRDAAELHDRTHERGSIDPRLLLFIVIGAMIAVPLAAILAALIH